MERLARYTLIFAVAVFWAAMWGTLLRRHLPGPPAQTGLPDYEQLLPPDEQERETEWDVHFGGRVIGTSHVRVRREPGGVLNLRTITRVESRAVALATGLTEPLEVEFEARISPLRGLLFFAVSSDAPPINLVGRPEGEMIELRGRAGGQNVQTTVPGQVRAFLGNSLSPMAPLSDLDEADVGRRWSVSLLNPLTGQMERTAVEVTEARTVPLDGEEANCFELTFTSPTGRWRSWVAEDGQVLVQGTPVGLVLRRRDLPAGVLPAGGSADDNESDSDA